MTKKERNEEIGVELDRDGSTNDMKYSGIAEFQNKTHKDVRKLLIDGKELPWEHQSVKMRGFFMRNSYDCLFSTISIVFLYCIIISILLFSDII